MYIFHAILKLDKILYFFFKKSLLINFKEFYENNQYTNKIVLGQTLKFFIPNKLIKWRVDTFLSKEPETIDWINSFPEKERFIFWDIGSNIGLYSIYNSVKNKDSITISFEPSTSNLRVLSRNISINKLEEKIKILSMPLTNNENCFQKMKEGNFVEGGALNAFGVSHDFQGNNFTSEINYQILGTTINYLLDNKILEIPNFIKIDVDGIEHLILEGANKYLNNPKIKSISVELNESFKEQFESVISLLDKNNFKILSKKHNDLLFDKTSKFNKVFNYVFVKK